MLKDFDFEKIDQRFDNYKRSELGERLDQLQRTVKGLEIPVLILIDGWESAGKGYVINDLTRELDPRYVRVEVFDKANQMEKAHPSVWRFWQKIPSNQEIVVYDRSFYYQVFNHDQKNDEKLEQRVRELTELDSTLINNGMIVIKFFINITEKTQKKRIKKLEETVEGKHLLSEVDYEQNKNYQDHQEWFEKILTQTNNKRSPWHIVAAEDKKYASKMVLGTVIDEIHRGIERIVQCRTRDEAIKRDRDQVYDVLDQFDLSKSLSKDDYHKELADLQEQAAKLVYQCYDQKIPIVLAFEGMDAAGKGGAIKRLTRHVDPRSYKIFGINAPDPIEEKFHYLWRFQKEMPEDGQMVIFDRSWYGRVLVERVENFTPERDWERAYEEINQMERTLADHGTAVMKFFLYIDSQEQYERFEDRVEDPAKNYKITAEDWRNREKMPQYLEAMNEMLVRTDTEYAPWYIVASNDKRYARIQVLKYFIEHLEKIIAK
ncbi:phosphate:AMP phosphotransferase [Facklamia sp. P12937]|uniref:phosphate:AMP phosphotransferase n=1 Tax=Facklamia sp. P12937 TaxID=3421949 RepID=UPI003D17CF6E